METNKNEITVEQAEELAKGLDLKNLRVEKGEWWADIDWGTDPKWERNELEPYRLDPGIYFHWCATRKDFPQKPAIQQTPHTQIK